ncbi:MAG: M48 family metallopeptidase [Clostridia bacterium]|nr:M48 family metallopeptidase [Clostridia bacterium]
MEYELIRSARRTVSVEVTKDLRVIVRAPYKMSQKRIDAFLDKHRDWIEKTLKNAEKKADFHKDLQSPQRQAELRRQAEEYLPKRTAEWAAVMGVQPTGVKITGAKTRFGSCSGKNSICYSYRLMAYPKEAVEYVIVHELAHILQKNHSARFYAVVERYLPDWEERRKLLK